MTPNIEVVADDRNLCGEAPTWDAANRRIVWTDNEADTVWQLDPNMRDKSILSRGLPVTGIALNRHDALVFSNFAGLHLWRRQDDYCTIVTQCGGDALQFNDIIADARGRIYAGTLYWGADGMEKTGRLYLIEPDGRISGVDDGIQIANGLGLSPDDRTLYFADSAARVIYAYDVDPDTGNLANRRAFSKVPDSEGIPDGLTVDADGFVWCAHWYGSQIVRYDPDGTVERRIPMPVTQVSSVAFGGDDLTDLYVTSAAEPWPSPLTPPGFDAAAPTGGALYRIRLDIQGKREHRAAFSWEPAKP